MSTAFPDTWSEANQRYLTAALAVVLALLERHAAHPQDAQEEQDKPRRWRRRASIHTDVPQIEEGEGPAEALDKAAEAMPALPALETLCVTFGLSTFERNLLLLCAGMELDSTFAAHCAAAQDDPQHGYPTFGLALAALPEAHWSALTPIAPLRYWRLVEPTGGDTLTASRLRIDERVLHYLAGMHHLDERLQGLVEPLDVAGELPPSHHVLMHKITRLWSQTKEGSTVPAIQLCGEDDAGKRSVASTASAAVGLRLHAIRAADVPVAATEREALARLWEREAVLSGSALLVECQEPGEAENLRPAISLLERLGGALVVTSREPLSTRRRQLIRLDVNKPSAAEQRSLWHDALGPLAHELNGQIEVLTTQFDLGVQEIRTASSGLLADTSTADEEISATALWDLCRVQSRPRLDDLAQRIEPAAGWDDLVLPEAQHQILREVAAHVRQRTRVYEAWGFAAKGARGLGISALFAGASGTGKTMAAEVLANELRLDLYRIDLSQVVSKYIGQTEKNLRRVFDAAEEGGAILLFDEADALFGKRSEVRDSHDRYANIEVSYLLQRMEAYRGLAVLTTNMKDALDSAFMRRIRFVVQFPFPDTAQRAEIWRCVFPPETPTEGLDTNTLSRLSVTGGNIRNIALNAAFLAADAGEPVRMAHLSRAARSEYAKLEKPLTESEIGGWA
jgi:ATPase family associated with various cellular activities (AAA)